MKLMKHLNFSVSNTQKTATLRCLRLQTPTVSQHAESECEREKMTTRFLWLFLGPRETCFALIHNIIRNRFSDMKLSRKASAEHSWTLIYLISLLILARGALKIISRECLSRGHLKMSRDDEFIITFLMAPLWKSFHLMRCNLNENTFFTEKATTKKSLMMMMESVKSQKWIYNEVAKFMMSRVDLMTINVVKLTVWAFVRHWKCQEASLRVSRRFGSIWLHLVNRWLWGC